MKAVYKRQEPHYCFIVVMKCTDNCWGHTPTPGVIQHYESGMKAVSGVCQWAPTVVTLDIQHIHLLFNYSSTFAFGECILGGLLETELLDLALCDCSQPHSGAFVPSLLEMGNEDALVLWQPQNGVSTVHSQESYFVANSTGVKWN